MSKFEFEIESSAEQTVIKISGHLDENFIHTEHQIPTTKKVIFDLERLEGINSCGIRDFINLLKDIPELTSVEYEKCPPLFIQQVNIVNGFLSPQRKVVSLFAPYIGIDDEEEMNHFIDVRNLNVSQIEKAIHVNGKEYEFDGIIEKYFRFLTLK
jgi:hypothetical protein